MMHSLSKIGNTGQTVARKLTVNSSVSKEERSKGRGAVRVVVSSVKEAEDFVLVSDCFWISAKARF